MISNKKIEQQKNGINNLPFLKKWKKKFRRIVERLIESSLFLCGSVTSVIIILIIVFLFKEGAGLFGRENIEDNYILALNDQNNVKSLSSKEIKDIFDAKITNWKQLGGENLEILPFRLSDVETYCSEEELGEDMENLDKCLDKIVSEQKGIIAFLPKEYICQNFNGKLLHSSKISIAQFFGGKEWIPTATPSAQFGILPLILGTLWVSLAAILLALPLGVGVAIYLAEIAGAHLRNVLKPLIELLAGIPSVVYGFFGLVIVVPFIQKIFNLPIGETGLSGAIILAVMALPTIITIAEDAMRNTPSSMREGSLALGATHWQTIFKVVIPYSSSGITAAGVLGIGRAIGETMAVLMVTGNAAVIPHSLLEPLRTIPATIAAELGESPKGGAHYEALFLLGAILFLITLIFNLIIKFITCKKNYAI